MKLSHNWLTNDFIFLSMLTNKLGIGYLFTPRNLETDTRYLEIWLNEMRTNSGANYLFHCGAYSVLHGVSKVKTL